MSQYAARRKTLRVTLGASVADNTNILSFYAPAGREIEVFGFYSIIRTPSPTAGAKVELVTAADAALSSPISVSVEGAADAVNKAGSLPKKLPSSTSDTIFHVRTDGASGVGCDVDVYVVISDPGEAS